MRRAFTMIELVFVIVVIGILASIAAPKFAATRDDATVTKAKTTVANIRTALSSEIQRKVLQADYSAITNLGGVINGYDKPIFDYFNEDSKGSRVLEYPPLSCKSSSSRGCWMRTGDSEYKYYLPGPIASEVGTNEVKFSVNNGRFECDSTHHAKACKLLEK